MILFRVLRFLLLNTLFNSCNNYLYRYEHDSILLKKRRKALFEYCVLVNTASFSMESYAIHS